MLLSTILCDPDQCILKDQVQIPQYCEMSLKLKSSYEHNWSIEAKILSDILGG
jgi:hypothetical protein